MVENLKSYQQNTKHLLKYPNRPCVLLVDVVRQRLNLGLNQLKPIVNLLNRLKGVQVR